MIKYIDGDIFNSPAQVIVNTVNTVGVMGKGIALEFKKRYPGMFEIYRKMCEKKQLKIGKLSLIYELDHWILLFPTKENWRYPSKLEYIESGLDKFVKEYANRGITSIAFPKLGCGNGELDWEDVKVLMEKYLKPLPIDIYIYLKNSTLTPEHKSVELTVEWLRANAKDLSFCGVKDDLTYHSGILPIEFNYNGQKMFASFTDKLVIKSNEGFEKSFSEEEFYNIWNYIRNQNVCSPFSENDTVVYELLLSLGYLTKVKIIYSNQTVDGYQLNSGIGRAYCVKE